MRQALDLRDREVISLVGGGGKTTLLFALARELVAAGRPVVTTTTTKILEPSPEQTPLLIVEGDEAKLLRLVRDNLGRYPHLTLASERLSGSKLKGVSPGLVVRLAEMVDGYIIVEADGSARRPLKAPNATEPVIPPNTSLVIAMVGADAIGCALTEDNVFRSAIASQLLGLREGETVPAEAVAVLVTHSRGIAKGSPLRSGSPQGGPGARIVPFLNRVDIEGTLPKARELARLILARRHPQIERVVLGQARSPRPVVEVVLRDGPTDSATRTVRNP
ncbi:MAG: putative selenium-dependent hydroxylase accessory protein YqeC [Chloroflexi bacterium]|nr:putative selenium-dependent hydroxylase accessory protein YqeC [Chloroflexota bacterium]